MKEATHLYISDENINFITLSLLAPTIGFLLNYSVDWYKIAGSRIARWPRLKIEDVQWRMA